MKKVILFIIVLFISASINYSQITITADDFKPQLTVGTKITTNYNMTLQTADIGSPGSTSWDFSGITVDSQFVSESKSVASSPYASDFPDAQYTSYYEGSFEGATSQTWVYTSLDQNLYFLGSGTTANIQGYNTLSKIVSDPKRLEYKLPLTYNSSWNTSGTQTISSTITIPVVGEQTTTLVQDYNGDYVVDAYGKLTMPNGVTVDALRIKETNTLSSMGQSVTTVNYNIIAKSGESITISVTDNTSTSGTVGVNGISWNDGNGSTDVKKTETIPSTYSLSQNYPNPFNPTTNISFSIPKQSYVSLKVYNAIGEEVSNLVNQELSAGKYVVDFNASKLSSGIYFYTIRTGDFTESRKMLLVK